MQLTATYCISEPKKAHVHSIYVFTVYTYTVCICVLCVYTYTVCMYIYSMYIHTQYVYVCLVYIQYANVAYTIYVFSNENERARESTHMQYSQILSFPFSPNVTVHWGRSADVCIDKCVIIWYVCICARMYMYKCICTHICLSHFLPPLVPSFSVSHTLSTFFSVTHTQYMQKKQTHTPSSGVRVLTHTRYSYKGL